MVLITALSCLSCTVDPLLIPRVDGTIEDVDTHQPISHAIVSTIYGTHPIIDGGGTDVRRQCAVSDDNGQFSFGADLAFNFILLYEWEKPTIRAMAWDAVPYAIPEAEGAQLEYWDWDKVRDRSSWATITGQHLVLKVRRWGNTSVREQVCTNWQEDPLVYSLGCQWLLLSWCSGH
jgi:hypothetical protein